MTGTAILNVTVGGVDDSAPYGSYTPTFPVVGSGTTIGIEVVVLTIRDDDSALTDTTVVYDCLNEPLCQDFTFSYDSSVGTGNKIGSHQLHGLLADTIHLQNFGPTSGRSYNTAILVQRCLVNFLFQGAIE